MFLYTYKSDVEIYSCIQSNKKQIYVVQCQGMHGKDGWVDAEYLDIKKACDKISHRRLLWKM